MGASHSNEVVIKSKPLYTTMVKKHKIAKTESGVPPAMAAAAVGDVPMGTKGAASSGSAFLVQGLGGVGPRGNVKQGDAGGLGASRYDSSLGLLTRKFTNLIQVRV